MIEEVYTQLSYHHCILGKVEDMTAYNNPEECVEDWPQKNTFENTQHHLKSYKTKKSNFLVSLSSFQWEKKSRSQWRGLGAMLETNYNTWIQGSKKNKDEMHWQWHYWISDNWDHEVQRKKQIICIKTKITK